MSKRCSSRPPSSRPDAAPDYAVSPTALRGAPILRRNLTTAIIVLAAAGGALPAVQTSGQTPTTRPALRAAAPTSRPAPATDGLQVARSRDGLRFETQDRPAIPNAAAPTMALLSDGRVMAVFERTRPADRRRTVELAACESSDDGRSWSPPRPLTIEGLDRRAGPPRSPSLARRPNGDLWLVVQCTDRENRRTLHAAASSDGRRFDVVGRLRLAGEDVDVDHPVAAALGDACHLLGSLRRDARRVYHGMSPFERRFKRLDDLTTPELGRPACLVGTEAGHRLYAVTRDGLRSAVSPDGRAWTLEPGVRLAGVADAAVVRLRDGSFLMLFTRAVPAADRRLARSTGADRRDRNARAAADQSGDAASNPPADPAIADRGGDPAGDPTRPEPIDADPSSTRAGSDSTQPPDDSAADPTRPDPASGDAGARGESDADTSRPDSTRRRDESWSQAEPEYGEVEFTEAGVPIPNFRRPIDYFAWFQQDCLARSADQNAYDYYAAFMPHPDDPPGLKPQWPQLDSMFNGTQVLDVPGPWNPADHPQWEATFHAAAPLMDLFSQASAIPNYANRPKLAKQDAEGPDVLLFNVLLPNLSSHRTLVKQAMSDAWRAPDGKADPDAMLNAIGTSLDAARHMTQGDYLIELLVGVAEKALVQDNARWALQRDVFDADRMESALELMIEKDVPLPDPDLWVRGEMAFCLDVVQYGFGPFDENRPPALNYDRMKNVFSFVGDASQPLPPPTPEQQAATTPEASVQLVRDYFREYADLARIGPPAVKPADLDQLYAERIKSNYLMQHMLPSLSRVYTLTTRHEASRRATQLAYAVNLHKARTGSWPASLDDLPPRYAAAARTDPFTNQDFVYRLTENGPLIYTAGQNGVDDGGRHDPRWGESPDDPDPSDDHVFWPPQRR